jgi:hypothetical protein
MATITNSLASGSHTLFTAGQLIEDIKAITFSPTTIGTTATVSLSIKKEGESTPFFLIRALSIKAGNVFVLDNPHLLAYEKSQYSLLLTTNQQTQVIVFT